MRKIINSLTLIIALGLFSGAIASTPGGNKGATKENKEKSLAPAGSPIGLTWNEIGPDNLGTGTRTIAINGSGTIFKGSMGGGLWKSTNGGSSWSLVTDISDNLAVSSVAVDGNNIYVGTGELYFYQPNLNAIDLGAPGSFTPMPVDQFSVVKNGFHSYSGTPGEGVFVSTDGGATFSHSNSTWTGVTEPYDNSFMSIQKVAAQDGRVLVGTLEGLYYSDDNLGTKTKATGPADFTDKHIVDIEFASGDRIFAATRENIFVSDDNGETFTGPLDVATLFPGLSDNPTPYNSIGGSRIEISIAPSDASVVYITGANKINQNCNGAWKSTDNGDTWVNVAPYEITNSTAFAPFGGAGRYAMVLAIRPDNPDNFLIGGDRLYQFSDSTGLIDAISTTYFPGFSTNYSPTPIHALVFDPSNSETMYLGTDMETMKSTDGGVTYGFKTNSYASGHMWNVSSSTRHNLIGTEKYSGIIFKTSPNIANKSFTNLASSPGHARFSMSNPDHIIAQGTDKGLIRSVNKGETFEQFYNPPVFPLDSTIGLDSMFIDRADEDSEGGGLYDDSGPPITAWTFDEVISEDSLGNDTSIQNSPVYVYFCSRNFVWVITNPFGGTDSIPHWNRITPDVIANSGKPKEYFTTITASGDDEHIVYAGTNYGKILRIFNANDPSNLAEEIRWSLINDGSLPERWITDLDVDPSNPDNLVITYGGYGDLGSETSTIYITNNARDTGTVVFRSIGETLDEVMPVYSAEFHPYGALIVGTEKGIYTTTDDWEGAGALTWNKENSGMYNVPVYDIQIRKYFAKWVDSENYYYQVYKVKPPIYIATHGRGIFEAKNIVVSEEPGPVITDQIEINLFPNPSTDQSYVNYHLPEVSHVKAEVFDIKGQLVTVLADREFQAGQSTLSLRTSDLKAGIYFVRSLIKNGSGEYNRTLRAVVVK